MLSWESILCAVLWLKNYSDDSSVAILEASSASSKPESSTISKQACLHFHKKITANNAAYTGIHPLVAHESHQENLATLVNEAVRHLPSHGGKLFGPSNPKLDFVSVTRGPGMRSSLITGIDTAKGLAVAWQIPLLGVNHMQAHALTPRLVSALNTPSPGFATDSEQKDHPFEPNPNFPFLTLLVSGGHTLLVHSRALTDHAILASTTDSAIGDCIDKMAREILPASLLQASGEIMYGRLLERFAFPNSASDYNYTAPTSRAAEKEQPGTRWGWSLPIPLRESGKNRASEFSFSGLGAAVRRLCHANPQMSLEERKDLAREGMRVVFEHLALRTIWALQNLATRGQIIGTLVISGGVASNGFLRQVLRSWLAAKGFGGVELNAPPVELCTDNAAMIAWCGVEMWRAGFESTLDIKAFRKWSIDPRSEGGILGVPGWKRRAELEGAIDEGEHDVV